MCGIVGIYDPDRAPTRDRVRRMADVIAHRGPDDDGFYSQGPICLGMRRLSIIDLEGGHQPIPNEDQSAWVVFNGEIYNYRQLRAELQARGHRFRTNSDTETILHQYEESGAECVHGFNGMFGFAIWNSPKQELFLARDRLGIKPLYYWWNGRALVFGSEIKSILASGMVHAEVDREALWHYLSFRYVPAPMTIWSGIRKLPPGHTLRLDGRTGRLEIQPYWTLHYHSDPEPAGEAEDQGRFDELFLDSVRQRLIADVPVGIFLSGGLDSSAVAAAVGEVHDAPLATFSVAFREGGEFSELGYAREVAHHLGTDHHEVIIGYREFIDFLPELVWHTDEPLADPASIPLYYVSRLAREKVKVVLSGEGADEVLAGYTFDERAQEWERLASFQRLPKLIRRDIPAALLRTVSHRSGLEKLERRNLPVSERNQMLLPYMTKYFTSAEKKSLYRGSESFRDSDDIIRGYYEAAGTPDALHQMLYAYCQDWLVEDLLMKADKMTMATSVELRVPFLDFRLVEWLATRPPEVKLRRNDDGSFTTKYLLRKFAEKRLPASILNRTKQGFPVPLASWMGGELGTLARRRLVHEDSPLHQWFEPDALRGYVDAGTSNLGPGAVQKLWLLFVLDEWARRWL